jgi:hypothetical protein
VSNVTLAEDGVYDVLLTDAIGSVPSQPARLSVLLTPIILQPPVNQTVVAGGHVTFSVAISGNPAPFRYEWRRGSAVIARVPASDSLTNVATLDTTSAGLVLAGAMPSSNYTCRIVITNAAHLAPGINTTFTVTVLADSDGDGLSDVWEQTYFGSSLGAERDADSDGDGLLNWQEHQAGTDPTSDASDLRVDSIAATGPTTLAFGAVSNRTYTVEFSDSLSPGSWATLVSVPARATNWTAVVHDAAASTNRFYRLVTP